MERENLNEILRKNCIIIWHCLGFERQSLSLWLPFMATALLLWRRMSHNWTRRCNHTSYPWIQSKLYPIFTKTVSLDSRRVFFEYAKIGLACKLSFCCQESSECLYSTCWPLDLPFHHLKNLPNFSFPRLLKQLYLLNKESEKLKLTAWLYFAIILACVQLTGPSDFFLRGRGRLYTGYCFYVFFCVCVFDFLLCYTSHVLAVFKTS